MLYQPKVPNILKKILFEHYFIIFIIIIFHRPKIRVTVLLNDSIYTNQWKIFSNFLIPMK